MREIRSASWNDFCQRISRQQQGGTLSIAVVEPDGRTLETVSDAIFESMILDTSGACNNVISVRAVNEREIVHEIIDPIFILLRESNGSGDYNPVEIEAENGKTLLTFRPAIHEDMLEGLDLIKRGAR
jgi:hypothetical protein